LGNYD
jgi:hypothetical protein